jgi:hypothetical protein
MPRALCLDRAIANNERVEEDEHMHPLSSNPLIEGEARRFVCRRVEPGKTRVAAHRRNRAAEDGKTVFVRASDELPQPLNHVIDRWLLRGGIERARAGEIVQADPIDDGLHAGLSERVALEACQHALSPVRFRPSGSRAVEQQSIARNG